MVEKGLQEIFSPTIDLWIERGAGPLSAVDSLVEVTNETHEGDHLGRQFGLILRAFARPGGSASSSRCT